jgi:hypothetical protein
MTRSFEVSALLTVNLTEIASKLQKKSLEFNSCS